MPRLALVLGTAESLDEVDRELRDLRLQSIPLFDQVILLLREIIHRVFLVDMKPGAGFDEAGEVRELILQIVDRLLRALLLLVRRLHYQ